MEDIIEIKEITDLHYGENQNQKAGIAPVENGIEYEVISRDKDLEYLDYLNISKALRVCAEFFDVNSGVIIRNNLICSAALGTTATDTVEKLIDNEPLLIKGSTVGFSKEVDLDCAKLLKMLKVKNVVAPIFSKEAYSLLLDTEIKLIAIKTPLHEVQGFCAKDIKVTPLGTLVQEQNNNRLSKETFNVVSQAKPSQEQAEDGIFGWKISKHLQSFSAVIAKDLCTKAIIQCCSDEVECVERAMDKACENSKDAVLVLDGAIENKEIINTAIQGRIGLIIEAGDAKNSQDILKYVDKYEISLIYTKTRNYKF